MWTPIVWLKSLSRKHFTLPLSCSCGREHTPLIGLTDDATFRTSSSVEFGAEFWISCVYDDMLERSFVSLRNGDRPDLTPLGDSPLLSPSLASASTSLRSTYEAWKAGTLTKASMVDIAPSDSIAAYFSAPPLFFFGLVFALGFVLALEGVPGFLFFCTSEDFYCSRYLLDSVGHFIARALSLTLSYEEAPGPSATEGRCFIRGDWRSTWFAERQV